jgi:hypothetical protein
MQPNSETLGHRHVDRKLTSARDRLLLPHRCRPVVQRRSRQTQQRTLAADTELEWS